MVIRVLRIGPTRRARSSLMLGLACAALVSACAGGSSAPQTSPARVPAASTASREAGRCLEDDPANMDFASPRDFVASVRSWRQLSGSSPDLEAYADKPVNKTVTVNLVAGAVGPGSSEQPTLQPVRIHGSMIPPARDALTSGGSVYFGGQQGAADPVLFTLIVSADGEHYFAGDCAYYGLTDPLRSSLRGGYDSELNRVVGMTTQADILDLLVPAQRSPSSS